MIDKDGNTLPDYEALLDINAFSLTKVDKGIRGVGRRIVNLLFQEKGTCPDDFDMGVGIKLYLYERANEKTLNELQSEATTQINKYIEDVKVATTECSYITPSSMKQATAGCTLVMTFRLAEPIEGKSYLSLKLEKKSDSNVDIQYFVD